MRTLAALALVAGALTTGVPAAHAAPLSYQCRTVAVAPPSPGPASSYQALLVGYIVSDTALEQVSIRCYLKVNNTPVSPDAFGANRQATPAFGITPVVAYDSDDVDICADWTAGAASGTECRDVTHQQVPPQEVLDLLDSLVDVVRSVLHLADGSVCPFLATLGTTNIPGVLSIDPEGDVFLFGRNFYDCPPYDEDESLPLVGDSVNVFQGVTP